MYYLSQGTKENYINHFKFDLFKNGFYYRSNEIWTKVLKGELQKKD
jgi:hypothetical protein